MSVVDVFIWSYEREAVIIRLANLKYCDSHIAVQATNTFRGAERKVELLNIDGVQDIVVTIPNGLDPWESEKWLRNQSLIEARKICPSDAWYMVSDGDEIPNVDAIRETIFSEHAMILPTDYRCFYADWRAKDHILLHQPTIGSLHDYDAIGGAGDARWLAQWQKSQFTGWHLSSLGNDEIIKEKISTFAHTEYDSQEYKEKLENARKNMRDFLDRFDLEYTENIPLAVPQHLLGGRR